MVGRLGRTPSKIKQIPSLCVMLCPAHRRARGPNASCTSRADAESGRTTACARVSAFARSHPSTRDDDARERSLL